MDRSEPFGPQQNHESPPGSWLDVVNAQNVPQGLPGVLGKNWWETEGVVGRGKGQREWIITDELIFSVPLNWWGLKKLGYIKMWEAFFRDECIALSQDIRQRMFSGIWNMFLAQAGLSFAVWTGPRCQLGFYVLDVYVGWLWTFDVHCKEVLRHSEISASSFPGSALSKPKVIILGLYHTELKLSHLHRSPQ